MNNLTQISNILMGELVPTKCFSYYLDFSNIFTLEIKKIIRMKFEIKIIFFLIWKQKGFDIYNLKNIGITINILA